MKCDFLKDSARTDDGDWYEIAPLPCRHEPSAECREQRGAARETERDRFCSSDAQKIDVTVGGPVQHTCFAEVYPRSSLWLVPFLGAFALWL